MRLQQSELGRPSSLCWKRFNHLDLCGTPQGDSQKNMTVHRVDDGNPFVPVHPWLPRLRGAARSSLGVQTLSLKESMPIHSFGKQSTREQLSKVYISAEHHAVRTTAGSGASCGGCGAPRAAPRTCMQVEMKGKSPAPLGYNVPAALDKQLEAQKRTAPRYSFSHLDRLVVSTSVPGGTCTAGQLGSSPAELSKQMHKPHAHLARRTRSPPRLQTVAPSTKVPGPGEYTLPGAFGPQMESAKQTQPVTKMGHAERESVRQRLFTGRTSARAKARTQRAHVTSEALLAHAQINKEYLSERMMTGLLGTLGPDPCTYGPSSALGKQVLSSKRTGPAFSLPSTERLKAEYERLSQSMPAPGQ